MRVKRQVRNEAAGARAPCPLGHYRVIRPNRGVALIRDRIKFDPAARDSIDCQSRPIRADDLLSHVCHGPYLHRSRHSYEAVMYPAP